jgi:hypothetical protein
MIARWPQADTEPSYFRLSKFGPLERDYSGVSIRLDSAVGPLSACRASPCAVTNKAEYPSRIAASFLCSLIWSMTEAGAAEHKVAGRRWVCFSTCSR